MMQIYPYVMFDGNIPKEEKITYDVNKLLCDVSWCYSRRRANNILCK